MLLNISVSEIAVPIISSILAALLTAFVTVKNFNKGHKGQYVIRERENWRKDIRNEFEKVTHTENLLEIKKFTVFMNIRLNPYDGEDIAIIENLNKIKGILEDNENKDTQELWNELSDRIALLLKHDWERAKREVNGNFTLVKISKYLFLTAIFIVIIDVQLILGSINEDRVIHSLINISFALFILKVVIVFFLFLKCKTKKCLLNSLKCLSLFLINLFNIRSYRLFRAWKLKQKQT